MYLDTYGVAAGELMADTEKRFRKISGGNEIANVSNPRGACRKRVCREETYNTIREMHMQGMSKRTIAKTAGCSPGHVQDVVNAQRITGGGKRCMEINSHIPRVTEAALYPAPSPPGRAANRNPGKERRL